MNEALRMVMDALRGVMGDKRYTTMEVEEMLDIFGYRCPDDLARSLNKLRKMGLVCGEVDREKACWVWWVEPSEKEPDQPV
ncbi:MAG TPA: hypothetical protein VMW85_05995 [Methanomassiliicoccales archaeon]|nr:hypothetical protein [Methanomassiliicoccales archaeon]